MPIDADLWGGHVWGMLHWFAADISEEIGTSIETYERFAGLVLSVANILPCPSCVKHFQQVLSNISYDTYLKNKLHVREWILALHNSVNDDGRTPWTLQQLDSKYPPSFLENEEPPLATVTNLNPISKQTSMPLYSRKRRYSTRRVGTLPRSMGFTKRRRAVTNRSLGVTGRNTRNYLSYKARSGRRGCGCGK